MSKAVAVVDKVLELINQSPRTPSRVHLLEVVHAILDADAPDAVTLPEGTQVIPRPGAAVVVEPNMSLTLHNWQIGSPRPLTNQEGALAVVEWMKTGILKAPRQ